ncbi:MAG: DUF4398 domain-containing protein [bacterium]
MAGIRIRSVVFASLVAFPGCYYFEAQDALSSAEGAFESAKAQGLEKASPYQYYLAEQYLTRAQIENRESDFASARDFARKSAAQLHGAAAAAPMAAPAAPEAAPPEPAASTGGSMGDMEVTPVAPPAPEPPPAAPPPREPELVVQPEPEGGN